MLFDKVKRELKRQPNVKRTCQNCFYRNKQLDGDCLIKEFKGEICQEKDGWKAVER
jgi:hypothetical protein